MKIKNTLYIIAALTLCAVAPLTRAQCTQTCVDNGNLTANIYWGPYAGSGVTGEDEIGIGNYSLEGSSGNFNIGIGDSTLSADNGGKNTGTDNTAIGHSALAFNSTGSQNTAVGRLALRGDDLSNGSSGSYNTAVGYYALGFYTTGNYNTANGYQALYSNSTGSNNVATGRGALYNNNTASDNTADGSQALNKNTTGTDNVALGRTALFNNTTGSDNVAIGRGALNANKTASQNTACGYKALNTSTGANNTAVGYEALFADTLGLLNTASGREALFSNTTGFGNSALGDEALLNNTTGFDNIGIGVAAGSALSTGGYNIDIGNSGVPGEGNTIRMGTSGNQTNTYIAGINGVTIAGGIGVIIDSNGHLGTSTSSARYKDNIQPMEKASEAILSLQPVTFRYKKELDRQSIPQFGLVAEEVEKVNPQLVAHDNSGKPYSVRYEAVNAMLLNEFLKEHRKVDELQTAVAQQQSTNVEQQKEIEALKTALQAQVAKIQQISDQVALSRSTMPAVASNR